MTNRHCKLPRSGPLYGMILKMGVLSVLLAELFTTGCTINRYNVVHNDQYLVIINGHEKDSQGDDESDGQVTTVPVGKKATPVPQRQAESKGSL